MSAFASAISLAYSNSFSLDEPACSGAVNLYTGARSGVKNPDAALSSSLGGVHSA